jgi:beta-lactamase superfamily II metal-dependent hydrolase/glucan-binding YG repeat protein
MNIGKKRFLFILTLLLFIGIPKGMIFAQEGTELNIYAIYLGENDKGDSTLLESRGHGLLIDIGSVSQTSAVVDQLQKVGLTHVDILFSHLHSDHMGATDNNAYAGLENLESMGIHIDTLYVPSVYLTPYSTRTSDRTSQLQAYADQRPDTNIVYLNVGDIVQVGDATGRVMGPTDSSTRSPYQYTEYSIMKNRDIIYENDSSLAMIFRCGNTKYFTAGDCYGREAKALVEAYGSDLKCDIMKMNHHGIGSGNSADLIKAISPKYSFVPNSGVDKYNLQSGYWRTYTATKRASNYGMCYMVGNEKKTIVYHIVNNTITLYKGSVIKQENKMTGWQYLYGADGCNRDHDMYYFDSACNTLKGTQKIGGHYFYFRGGGQMDYGTYSKDGGYSGWKTYNGKKRYFTFSEDHEYAYMKEGLNFINGVPMYFDNSGYLVTSEIEDETAIKKMDSYYYAVDCCGEVTIDDWAEIDDSFYYFDRKGRMLRNGKYKINGDYYLFDTDGIMYAGDLGIEFYDFKSNTYAVRTDGTLVSGKCGKIDGKEYYFDKTGIMQKNKIIRIGKKQYYFNKNGEMVHNRTFKLYGKKYHSNSKGVIKVVKTKK